MNKIFKVIFNRTTGKLVVVSELSKSNGKASSSTDERVGVSSLMTKLQHQAKAALVLGLLGVSSTGAAITQGTGTSAHGLGVAIGDQFVNWDGSTKKTEAKGEAAVAIGSGATANTGKQSVAIGQLATASGSQSVALGGDTKASAYASIAIGGDDADTTDYANWAYNTDEGRVKDTGSGKYQSTTASGAASIAIGTKSQATQKGAVGLGVLASATGSESIALGAKSAAKGANSSAVGAGTTASGADSVAAGYGATASAANTVAVGKGAQATGADSTVAGTNARATGTSTVAIGSGAVSLANNAITMGYGATTTTDSANAIAIGTQAASTKNSDFAIGNKAKAMGGDSVAMGTLSRSSAVGAYASGIAARAVGKESVALGWMASTGSGNTTYDGNGSGVAHVASGKNGDYSIAVGSNMAVTGQNSIGIGKAGNKADATVTGDNSIAIGHTNNIDSNKVVAIGNNINIAASVDNSTAIGESTSVTKEGGVALGQGSSATVAAGAKGYDILAKNDGTGSAWTSGKAAVSVGTSTSTRQITNVAGGTADSDAVNVAQLKRAKVEVLAGNNVKVTTDTSAGYTKYTISSDAAKTEVEGTGGVVVTPSDITGGKKFTVKLSDENQAKLNAIDAAALNAAKDKVNQGLTFAGNAGNPTTKQLGNTVNIVGSHNGTEVSSKNIKTEVAANGNIEIKMTEKPEFKEVTIDDGDNATGKTVIGKDGLTVKNADGTDGPSVTKDGIAAGGKKITGVAEGTGNNDAVNVAQLKKLENVLGLAVDKDGNLTPLAKQLRDETGKATESTGMSQLVYNTVDRVNEGVVYGGDTDQYIPLANTADNRENQQLGSKLSVVSATTALTKANRSENFVGDNLVTKYVRNADGSGAISIAMSEKPEFKEVTAKDGDKETKLSPTGTTVKYGNKEATYGVDGIGLKGDDGKTTTLGRDAEGNLTVDKDGANNGEAPVKLATEKDIDAVKNSANDLKNKLGLPTNTTDGSLQDLAIPKVEGSGKTAAPTTLYEAVNDTVTAVNKGISLKGNNYTEDTATTTQINKKLGEVFEIVGSLDKNAEASDKNIRTEAKDGKLHILMSEKPEFKEVTAKDGDKETKLTPTGTTVKDGNKEATYGVDGLTIKGADGKTTKLGTDQDGNLTVTNGKDGIDGTPQKLVTAENISSMTGTDGKDGKNGAAGSTGPTGQDGLNGTSLDNKINALRNGEAGPIVYTNAAGERLVKGNDGSYYPASQVNPDGTLKDGATAEPNPIASVVNPDGSTTKPTAMGNVKSTIGLDGKDGNNTNQGPISTDAAQKAVAGNGKDGNGGLLTKSGPELNNAATVGDLQALAQAGLDFTGNNATENKDVHRPLGTKLTIEGETTKPNQTKAQFGETAADNIHVEAKGADNKLVVSLSKDLKNLKTVKASDSVQVGDDKNGVKITPAGTTTTKTDANGNKTEAVSGADGTSITGPDGKSAEYKLDGSKVNDGKGNETSVKADGMTVKSTDPNDKSEAHYGKDGLTVKGNDGKDAIALTSTEGADGKTTNALALKGEEGKDAVSISSGADGKDPTMAFAKDGNNGTGSITGLKDVERNPDGTAKDRTAAANAGYVDDRLKEMNDGKPFEYFDEDGNQVVRGKDGKFYDPKALEGKVYDPTTKQYYPAKADGTADTAQAPVTTGKPASDVVIKAMPNEAGPVAMGNVGSGLGLDAYNGKPGADGKTVPAKYDATKLEDVKAAQDAADKLYALDGDKLNNVVTAGDLQALAVAGLDFTGNNNVEKTLHRSLGSKLVVEGETTKVKDAVKQVTKADFGATAADNIHVEAKVDGDTNKLIVSLTEDLKNIGSLTTKPVTNADGIQTSTKLTPEGTKVSKVKPAVVDPVTGQETTPAKELETANYGLTTELKKTDADGKVTTSTSTPTGTTLSEEDKDGNKLREAEYDLDGTKVTSKDPATGATKETTTGVDGTTVKVTDPTNPNNDKSAKYGVDGTELKAKDAEGNPVSADYKVGGATVKDKDNTTEIKPDGMTVKSTDEADKSEAKYGKDGLTIVGKDGKDGKDGISLGYKPDTNADGQETGTSTPTLEFGKGVDGKGTGAITGLKDVERNPDGSAKDKTAGASTGYVDERLAEADAGKPFEYFETDPTTGKVKTETVNGKDVPVKLVRGQDGKFYKPEVLEGKVYVEGKGYVNREDKDKPDATALDLTASEVKPQNVTIQAMPASADATPIAMNNVGSGLGLDDSKEGNKDALTKDQAQAAMNGTPAKDGQPAKPGLLAQTGEALNNVATVKDLQALAQAGLDFTGNNNVEKTLHRPLGSKLVVEGETTKVTGNVKEVTKATFGATAADNIHVEAKVDGDTNKLIVSLTEDLKNIGSLTTKPVDNGDGTQTTTKLTPEGTKVSKVKPAEVDATGTVTKPAEEVESSNYGLNTEMKKTAEDGTVTTSTSNAGGTVLTEKTPEGKETISVETAGGTSLSEKDKDGNETKAANYNLDGTKVTSKDPATGTTKETSTGVDGTKVTSKDPATGITKETSTGVDGTNVVVKDANNPNNNKSADYGVDGTALKAKDAEGNPVTADYKVGGATIADKDNTTEIKPDGMSVKSTDEADKSEAKYGKDGLSIVGKDGKDGKDGIALGHQADTDENGQPTGTSTPTLAFGKGADGKGTGVITGLKDLERNPDGTAKDKTAAATAGYVDDRINHIGKKLGRATKELRAGIAGANAAAGLPQVYLPGKSMVAAAAGGFKGQSAIAVGYSTASDNGKVIFKLQGNANSAGDFGGSVGIGYQW